MRIINAIFGRKKGDIEQTFVDYTRCLVDLGCDVTVLTYQDAPIIKLLAPQVNAKTIANFGQWDPLAGWKLKKAIRDVDPSVIIAHGNRATALISKAASGIPVVGVCHNVNLRQSKGCDAFIAVTEDLRKSLIKKGYNEQEIYTIPHMVYIPPETTEQPLTWHNPPVIGVIGRLVAKKGVNVFLRALSLLKIRGLEFKAIIGGDGTDMEKLKNLAKSLDISELVEFKGWIENKDDFFSAIDIFCLPSLHEPVGMVILESFLHSKPVIVTDTEGPMEIVRPHIDALMVEAGEASALADAIEKLIKNPKFAERLVKEGFKTVMANYESKAVGKRLYSVLEKVTSSKPTPPKNESDDTTMESDEMAMV